MFDISGVDIDKTETKYDNIYNDQKILKFCEKYVYLENVCKATNNFKNMLKCEKEYILNEIIKENKKEVHDEMCRLMKISPHFAATRYFKHLAKFLCMYCSFAEVYRYNLTN